MRAKLELQAVTEVSQLSREVLREWGAGLHDAWRPATVKASVATARSFLRWLQEEES